MIPRAFHWRALLCGFVFPTVAFANPMGLASLLKTTAEQNPSILQIRSRAQAAGFEVEAAKFGRFPSIYTDGRSQGNGYLNSTRIEQPLWTGGRITGQISLAEANEQAARAQILETEFNVLSEVSVAYFDLLRAQAKLKSAEENIQEHQRLVDLIQRRVTNEISAAADLTLAKARLQSAISEKIQIGRQLDISRQTVARLSGATVSAGIPPKKIAFSTQPRDEIYVQKANEFSAQRRRLLFQIESARQQIAVASAQAWPVLLAGYQHYWSRPLPLGYTDNKTYFSLQYQPGAGLSAISLKEAAVMQQEAARQELENLDRTLEANVRSAVADIEAFRLQEGPAKLLLTNSAEVLDSYIRQYQVGRRNWLEVLNTQREKTQAAYNLADVEYGLQASQVKLMLLTGDLHGQQLSALHD